MSVDEEAGWRAKCARYQWLIGAEAVATDGVTD